MVQVHPDGIALSHSHHVARYCRRRHLRSDGRPLRDAFLLRLGEEYLSTNWLEHFHDSDRPAQIVGVSRALTDKGFPRQAQRCVCCPQCWRCYRCMQKRFEHRHPSRSSGRIARPVPCRHIWICCRGYQHRRNSGEASSRSLSRNLTYAFRPAYYAISATSPSSPGRPRRPPLRRRGVRRVARLGPARPGRAAGLTGFG